LSQVCAYRFSPRHAFFIVGKLKCAGKNIQVWAEAYDPFGTITVGTWIK
jgi:hypothetical protein